MKYIVRFDKEFLSGNLKGLTVGGQSIVYPNKESAERVYKVYANAMRNRKRMSDVVMNDKFIPRNVAMVPMKDNPKRRKVSPVVGRKTTSRKKRMPSRRKRLVAVKRNPLVSKEQKFLVEGMQSNYVPVYVQLSSKGVSRPTRFLWVTNRVKASRLSKYNASHVAREILPYQDKRMKWLRVVPA